MTVKDINIKYLLKLLAWQNDVFISEVDSIWRLSSDPFSGKCARSYDLSTMPYVPSEKNIRRDLESMLNSLNGKHIRVSSWGDNIIGSASIEQHHYIEHILNATKHMPLYADIDSSKVYQNGMWTDGTDPFMSKKTSIEFHDSSLLDATIALSQITQTNIVLHSNTINPYNDIDHITLQAHQTELWVICEWIAKVCDIQYTFDGECILFGGKNTERCQIRAYQLFGASNQYDDLRKVIRHHCSTDSDRQGRWTFIIDKRILVSAPRSEHLVINELLQSLRPHNEEEIPCLEKSVSIQAVTQEDKNDL